MRGALFLVAVAALWFTACRKDHFAPFPDPVGRHVRPNYPISVFEAMTHFASVQGAATSSLNSEHAFVKLDPVWSSAYLSQSQSGQEIVVVPLADSSLRVLNDGRADAKLLFSKDGPDEITAEIMLYLTDSLYYVTKNGQTSFVDYTGAITFYDIGQHFKHGVFVKNGNPVSLIDSISKEVHTTAPIQYRYDWDCCNTVSITFAHKCNYPNIEYSQEVFCTTTEYFVMCQEDCGGTVSDGGSGSGAAGPGNVTGPGGPGNGWPSGNISNNGTNTGGIANEVQALLWQIYSGSVPIDALNYYSAIGTYLPSGLTFARISMLVEIQKICKFTNADRHLLDWLQYNPSHISKIHAFVTRHNVEPPPLEAGNEYAPNMNDRIVAVAVTKAYIQLLQKNSHEMQEMLSNIEGLQVGDPLLDMIAEQFAEALKALLIDLIPGGTFVTNIPAIVQHFENGDILEGIWECVTTMLDEGQRALPVLKAANLTIGIVQIADKMSDFYQVIKKAEKLGGDVAFKIYQVLRNRLDGLYTKMKWGGNSVGAKITGAGDPLDVWDDLIEAFPGGQIDSGNNGNEIKYTFYVGGNKLEMRIYLSSTSSGEPTISIKKGNFEFKMRF